MTIAIRLSCVVAAALALESGSASARDGLDDGAAPRDPALDVPFPDGTYWADYETYAPEGDPTGGAVFYETLGGDAMSIASGLGFDVTEVYAGSCVADPSESNGLFDAIVLCSILNGADPYTGAEPDQYLQNPEGSGFAGGVLGSSFGRAQYLRQPAVAAIRGRQAHEFATGAGVTVAVLDTGIDPTHTLFTMTPGTVLPGRDFVDSDDQPLEENGREFGHGTTVSGLVLLAAPDARILPVRVLDGDGVGTAGRIAAGIRFATDAGAGVVNLSLGGGGVSSAVRDALADAMGRGVVIVAAAGNSRRPGAPQFPASEPGVIAATGSIGHSGDVWAPAIGLAGPYPGERWFRGDGTSYSCALVSGGAAIAKQRYPGVTASEIVAALPLRPNGVARLDLSRLAHRNLADVVTTLRTAELLR